MKSIILIGMPGAGKSTVGVVLAKAMGLTFCDTDLIIQSRENMLLQDIIDEKGTQYFLECEQRHILSSTFENMVVATGGSVVYGENAMRHLKKYGTIVYLYADKEEILMRIGDSSRRGIAGGEDMESVFRERLPLYEKYAQIKIDCTNGEIRENMEKIKNEILKLRTL